MVPVKYAVGNEMEVDVTHDEIKLRGHVNDKQLRHSDTKLK